MLTPNNPMSEYASSSCLVVLRPMAQHIRWAMLKFENRRCRVKTVHGMPVIWERSPASVAFVPISRHSLEKNTTTAGAMSSWSVHPRVCHRLFRNGESWVSRAQPPGTSARYA